MSFQSSLFSPYDWINNPCDNVFLEIFYEIALGMCSFADLSLMHTKLQKTSFEDESLKDKKGDHWEYS
ncbi:hypothetical protein L596_021587 [Steinernema carpocapsae]|uniref:Uncharacterized protein n=1 Tax=Steinernema carpocapsae TaxID=34508 RepID=A0A4U5MK07_STECR|nr:hypothetical protein L596_021587 [Steinernema carpocapsae]